MESGQVEGSEKVLAKALSLLRESGFTAAAEKLAQEFDSSAPADEGSMPDSSAHRPTVVEKDDIFRYGLGDRAAYLHGLQLGPEELVKSQSLKILPSSSPRNRFSSL
jgi:hypothetical protein